MLVYYDENFLSVFRFDIKQLFHLAIDLYHRFISI